MTMARNEPVTSPQEQLIGDATRTQVVTVDPNDGRVSAVVDDRPTLEDGHDHIVEDAPGMNPVTDVMPPAADPGDLSALDRSAGLPDLGVGDDPALGDVTNPGGEFGSTLLDDLAGDLPDPTDGIDGMGSDDGGLPVIDDQTGWAMDGGGSFPYGTGPPDIGQWDTVTTTTDESPTGDMTLTTWEPAVHDDDPEEGQSSHGTEQPGAGTEPETGDPWVGNFVDPDDDGGRQQDEAESPTSYQVRQEPSDTDEDEEDEQGQEEQEDDHEPQTSDGPTQGSGDSTPIPPEVDDGTGGDPEPGDFIGGRGDVDPPPETEDHGGGELIGGRGDVDPAPETDDAGGAGALDMERLGVGVIDPLKGESSLLGDDAGGLEDMAAESDFGDVEIEFDDSLADADIGAEA